MSSKKKNSLSAKTGSYMFRKNNPLVYFVFADGVYCLAEILSHIQGVLYFPV